MNNPLIPTPEELRNMFGAVPVPPDGENPQVPFSADGADSQFDDPSMSADQFASRAGGDSGQELPGQAQPQQAALISTPPGAGPRPLSLAGAFPSPPAQSNAGEGPGSFDGVQTGTPAIQPQNSFFGPRGLQMAGAVATPESNLVMPPQQGGAQSADDGASAWGLLRHPSKLATPPPPQAPPPPHLQPPEFAFDQAQIRELTVEQVAGIVFNENRDVTPGKMSAEDLLNGKIAQAHAVINGDRRWGPDRQKYAGTATWKVSDQLKNTPQFQQALAAARQAFQEDNLGTDTSGGRFHFNHRFDHLNPARPRKGKNGAQYPGIHYGPFRSPDGHDVWIVGFDEFQMYKPNRKGTKK